MAAVNNLMQQKAKAERACQVSIPHCPVFCWLFRWEKWSLWTKWAFKLNGTMAAVRASKSAISILMASNVAVIVECRGPIMANTLTRLNALTAAMYMEQMGLICMRESALSAKKEHPESGIGGLLRNEIISQNWRGIELKRFHHGKAKTKTHRRWKGGEEAATEGIYDHIYEWKTKACQTSTYNRWNGCRGIYQKKCWPNMVASELNVGIYGSVWRGWQFLI